MGLLANFQNKCKQLTYSQLKACISVLQKWETRLLNQPLHQRRPEIYKGKVILAPMVKVGYLPMRLLALKYGADLVYTDEISAYHLKNSKGLQTGDQLVRYVKRTIPIFETCPAEKNRVILQLGTNDPKEALEAAKLVQNDVLGIDVNLGCPAPSAEESMTGAFLLDYPDLIIEILRTLVNNLEVPVTCKIRVLPQISKTLDLVERIEAAGVSALAVHGRLRTEKRNTAVRVDEIRQIAEAVSIPVIASGGSLEFINNYDDILKFGELVNCSSVMVGQSALGNASVFRKEGPLHLIDVIREFVSMAIAYNQSVQSTVFILREIARHHFTHGKVPTLFTNLSRCENYVEMCELLGIESSSNDELRFTQDKDGCIEMHLNFKRGNYSRNVHSPKSILHEWAQKNKNVLPVFQTMQLGKAQFTSKVTFDGMCFKAIGSHRTAKYAEQASSIVCLRYLGLDDGRKLHPNEEVDVLNDIPLRASV